jgi:hypothetical protein
LETFAAALLWLDDETCLQRIQGGVQSPAQQTIRTCHLARHHQRRRTADAALVVLPHRRHDGIQRRNDHRYRIWHPIDHIYYKDLSRAPDGTGSAGTRRHIVEAFGANRNYLINIIDRVEHLDDKGVLLATEQGGISLGFGNLLAPLPIRLSTLEHQFFAVSNGTRYESRLLIGLDSSLGKWLVNPIVRPLFIGYEMAKAWLKHNIEEVGNFEFFLPELYNKFN